MICLLYIGRGNLEKGVSKSRKGLSRTKQLVSLTRGALKCFKSLLEEAVLIDDL